MTIIKIIFKEKTWPRNRDYIIFDELHKLDKWNQWLKSIYDVEDLRRPYDVGRGYGVTKLHDADVEWNNIYFVVPKPIA